MVTGMRIGAWFSGLGRLERLTLVWLAGMLILGGGGIRMRRSVVAEAEVPPPVPDAPAVTEAVHSPVLEVVAGAPYEPAHAQALALGATFRVVDEEVRLLDAGRVEVVELDAVTAPILTVEAFPGRFAGSSEEIPR